MDCINCNKCSPLDWEFRDDIPEEILICDNENGDEIFNMKCLICSQNIKPTSRYINQYYSSLEDDEDYLDELDSCFP